MLIFMLLSLLLSIFYLKKIYNEPIHPDSAEFIYAGMLQRLGFRKEIFVEKEKDKSKTASLNFTDFPPEPTMENYHKYFGAFPLFRDKMFVWWFFEKLYKYLTLPAQGFRYINTLLIFIISSVFYLNLAHYVDSSLAVVFTLFFQITLMLPHFDFYQIHAEEWGILLLAIETYILIMMNNSIFFPIAYGIILATLLVFIKITFGLTILYFLISPLILFHNYFFFQISSTFFLMTICLFLMIFVISGKRSDFLRVFNLLHWKKYKEGSSTSRSDEQRAKSFSINRFFVNYCDELLVIMLFLFKFIRRIQISTHFQSVELFLLIWLLITATEIFIQGKFYPSHFLPLTIPGLLYIFIFFDFFSVFIMMVLLKIFYDFFVFSDDLIMKKYGEKSQNPFLKIMLKYGEISDFIGAETTNKDQILCIGYLSPVYVMTNRRGALGIFEAGVTTEPIDLDKKYGIKWHWWLMNAMIRMEPKFVIDSNGMVNAIELQNSSGIRLKLKKNGKYYRIFQPDFSEKYEYPKDIGENIFNKNINSE